jgi:hypothetical protein
MGEAKLRLKGELRSPLQIASRFNGAAATTLMKKLNLQG